MLDWLFGKSRSVSNGDEYPRVMVWGSSDPDEWCAYYWTSDDFSIPKGVEYVVFDLRGIDAIGGYDSLFVREALDMACNSAVISDRGVNVQSREIVFIHDDKRGDSGQRKTVVSIRGSDPNGTMARVAQMMAINQTTIHGISYCSDGHMLDVVTESINGPFAIRVPEGEKAYIYDTHLHEDGTMTGYVIYIDKDMKIPAESMEMFKAIGELNAK